MSINDTPMQPVSNIWFFVMTSTNTIQFDGQTHTAPLSGENTSGIIYNKKYFDDNGFTGPITCDEFIELCQTIQDREDMAPS